MEFHGVSMDDPWNSMEFHEGSMEFHGGSMEFHGDFMEFHGVRCKLHGTAWTSMEPPPWKDQHSMQSDHGLSGSVP